MEEKAPYLMQSLLVGSESLAPYPNDVLSNQKLEWWWWPGRDSVRMFS